VIQLSLSRIAAKNSVVSLVEYFVKLFVTYITVPIIIALLGMETFGIWRSLQRVSEDFSLADFRASQTFKWLIATKANASDEEKRGWLVFSMMILVFGVVIFFVLALFLGYAGAFNFNRHSLVVMWILVVAQFIFSLSNIFLAIIQGTNNGYRRIIGVALINISLGLMIYFVLNKGYGLIGVALAFLMTYLFSVLYFIWLSHQVAPWVGLGKFHFIHRKSFIDKTAGFFGWSLILKGIMFGDVLIIAAVLGGEVVGEYALQIFLPQMLVGMVSMISMSAMPGLGKYIENNDTHKVSEIRSELHFLTWFLFSVGAAPILLLNHDFIALWVPEAALVDSHVGLLIILMSYFLMLLRNDAFILDLYFSLRTKLLAGGLSLFVMVTLSYALGKIWGIEGVCLGIIVSRVFLVTFFAVLVKREFEEYGLIEDILKMFFGGLLLTLLHFINIGQAESWILLIGKGALTALVAFGFFLVVSGSSNRKLLMARFHKL